MKRLYNCITLRLALTARLAALVVFGLVGYGATTGDLDLTPLGVWPEAQLSDTFLGPDGVLANGRFFQRGVYRGAPALLALDPHGAKPFELVGALPLADVRRLAIAGHHAIVTGSSRLFVVDISDPSSLRFEGMTWIGSVGDYTPFPLAVSGTHAYVVRSTDPSDLPGASPARITVVDFSDPRNPRIVGEQTFPPTAATAFWLSAAAAADGVLCVASSSTDWESPVQVVLDIFDLRDPAQPRWVGKHEAAKTENIHALALVGRRAYWAPFAFSGTTRLTKLQVVDLTDPAAPKLLGTYSTTGEVKTLAANERYVYAAKEIQTDAGPGSAVDIVDVGNPATPKRVGGSTVKTFDGSPTLYIEGGLMVVRSFYGGTSAYDISDPAVMRRLGGHKPDLGLLDVTLTGNRAFTVGIGQMSILDVSQPEAPRLLGAYPLPSDLAYIGKVAVAGNYAYLPTSVGLQTIDVTDPAAPRRTSLFGSASYFTSAAVEGNLLAVASVYDGVFFLDLTNPAKPVRRGRADLRHMNNFFVGRSVAISGHHVFVTSADDQDSQTGVLEIFDASDPASPRYVGAYEVPAVARDVAVSGHLAVVTSYSRIPAAPAGYADILDVTDPSNPVLLASEEFDPLFAHQSGARVSMAGDRAILGGPKVLDLSDPTKPRQLAGLAQQGGSATISGDVLFAGLNTYRMSPATLSRSRTLGVGGQALGVALQGNLAWLALGKDGLQAVDRTKPDATALLGRLPLDGKAWDVAITGNQAVVAAGEAGLVILDTTDPANPQQLGALDTPGAARSVAVAGNTACVADFTKGVRVVDIGNPTSPRELAGFATPGYALDVAWHGTHALVACREAGLQVLDLAVPTQPKLVGSYLVRGAAEAVTVVGDLAFIADGLEGFMVLDVSDPTKPKRLGLAPGNTQARSIVVAGRFAYVADVTRGIRVYDIGDPTGPREVGGTSAVNTYHLEVAGDRLLAAAGSIGLVEFEFFVAPVELGIVHSGNAVRLTWPTSALGYRLESSNALNSMANWLSEPTAPELVGDQNVVTLELRAGPRFFRLRKP
jgi:hypothetical protein